MSAPPVAGARLGRYRLERLLGQGGSGLVFEARDTLLGTTVAVKVLSREGRAEGEPWERFKRELLIARRLSHPGICRVFDIHEEGDQRFITMEYVAGRSLHEILKAERRL